MLAHYRRLIALRHAEPVVALGDFTMLLPDHEQVYAFTRSLEGRVLLVLANAGREPVPLAPLRADLPRGLAGAAVLLGNLGGATADTDLRPWEARVLDLPGDGS